MSMDQKIFEGKKIKIEFPALNKNVPLSDELRLILIYYSFDNFMNEEKNLYALRKYLCNVFGIENYPAKIEHFGDNKMRNMFTNVNKMRNMFTAIRLLNINYAPKADVTLKVGSHVLVVDMSTGDIQTEFNVKYRRNIKGRIRDVITTKDGTQVEMVSNDFPNYLTVFSLGSIEDSRNSD